MNTPRHTSKPRYFVPDRLLRQRRLGIAFLLLALAARAGAQSAESEPQGLQFADGHNHWNTAVALDTDVRFRIQGLLAEVTIEQTYRNASPQWLEGRYLLPLPENAAVHALELNIGERVVSGEVREKQEAQAIYQAAAAQGQAAGLVEQNRPNLFRTAVANIGPGETVKVKIGYWQRVNYHDGVFSIDLPLTLTPRYEARSHEVQKDGMMSTQVSTEAPTESLPAAASAQFTQYALEPTVSLRAELVAGVALQAVQSPTHAIEAQLTGDRATVVLKDGVIASDRDFELQWIPEPTSIPQSALFVEKREDATYALAMLLPPTLAADALPRELLMVIDTSGSMEGLPLKQAQTALSEALTRLRPGDRFNLIQFNSVSESLFQQSVPADAEHLRAAKDWVAALAATGGTEMRPALELALAGSVPNGYVRQVVFMTDAAIGNESELLAQIERQLGRARLFPVGIGSAPNDWFLRKAAEVGRGSELLIRAPEQVVERMDTLFAKLDRPALSDIELHWPSGAQTYPERLPDLYHGEPLIVVAQLPAAIGLLKARGWSPQGEWQDALNSRQAYATDGVARLWGRSKIEALEDALRQGADEAVIRPEIVALGLEHQLVSRFTSLIAVERTPTRPSDASLDSVRFENAAPADSLAFAQGGTAARSKLALAAALALLALALLRPRS